MVLIFGGLIFILEFKFQNQNGSVTEKLQTGKFKQNFYRKYFKNYKIYYIYILSPWFKNNCIYELQYLEEEKIAYYFSNEKWVLKLIAFIKKKSI